MEQQIPVALERIENPILIILLVVLMMAVIALWMRDMAREKRLVEMILGNIGSLKDIDATLRSIREAGVNQTTQLGTSIEESREHILERISSLEKTSRR